jgi:hypothetical protein
MQEPRRWVRRAELGALPLRPLPLLQCPFAFQACQLAGDVRAPLLAHVELGPLLLPVAGRPRCPPRVVGAVADISGFCEGLFGGGACCGCTLRGLVVFFAPRGVHLLHFPHGRAVPQAGQLRSDGLLGLLWSEGSRLRAAQRAGSSLAVPRPVHAELPNPEATQLYEHNAGRATETGQLRGRVPVMEIPAATFCTAAADGLFATCLARQYVIRFLDADEFAFGVLSLGDIWVVPARSEIVSKLRRRSS